MSSNDTIVNEKNENRPLCNRAAGISKVRRVVYVILGSVFLLLGLTGVFLPVLPTTPFLLLTAYFYLRSSYRLYCWLINHRLFGSYINDYMQHRAVRKKAKITALVFLWSTMLLTIILVPVVAVRVILPIIGIAVTAHILSLKTLK
ncbi:MAG: uncharacterized protein PWP10_3855 [Clostridiales bacterium]|nr:YbaN family protein [Eubacteriales bacterium]MDD3198412.1 YbaN family protein [Eubacteriales bacterium]MDD4683351.1 YbaN family protein [Eubacteriales bacterium]MDN5315105.1 uncharacterized protein [Clostridiales bacterium]